MDFSAEAQPGGTSSVSDGSPQDSPMTAASQEGFEEENHELETGGQGKELAATSAVPKVSSRRDWKNGSSGARSYCADPPEGLSPRNCLDRNTENLM